MSNIALEIATSKEVALVAKQAFSKLAPVVEKNPVAVGMGVVAVGCFAYYLHKKSQQNVTNITINNYYF